MNLLQLAKQGSVPRQYRFRMPFDSRLDIIPGSSILSEAKDTIYQLGTRYSREPDVLLGEFGLPHARSWGFGNAVHRLFDQQDHEIWALTIPSTTLYSDDPVMFERNLLWISATLKVVFSGLNMSRENISEDGEQLLFINEIIIKPNENDFSLSVLLLKPFFDWLAVQDVTVRQKCEQRISDAMDDVHTRLTGVPYYPHRQVFKLHSGSQYISLPSPNNDGSSVSLHPDGPGIDDKNNFKILYYGFRSNIELLTFLTGIAALCDFVISHTAQKEESK